MKEMTEGKMKKWRKETLKVYGGKDTGDLKSDVRKVLRPSSKSKALAKAKKK